VMVTQGRAAAGTCVSLEAWAGGGMRIAGSSTTSTCAGRKSSMLALRPYRALLPLPAAHAGIAT
jgi:hypothetical protein